jgi:germination protein M
VNRPTRRRHSLSGLLCVGLALVAIIAACSPSGGLGQVPSPAPTPAPSVGQGEPDVTAAPSLVPPSPTPGGSPQASPPASPGETTIIRSYFYLDGEPGSAGLVALLREVPRTPAVGTAAMNALLAGPDPDDSGERAVSSAIPEGSRLLGLTIEDGIATVDLSREYESGGGSLSMFTRLGQVVFTLTQFPTVEAVLFEIEGRPVTVFSSEGIVLDGPVGRADYEDLLPAIFVDRPAYGASLGNPARIAGTANVFEATFMVTLLDGDGATIAEAHTMATCGTGCRGTFDLTLPYDVTEAGWGALLVWAASAKDGSPEWIREYPIWLEPAG